MTEKERLLEVAKSNLKKIKNYSLLCNKLEDNKIDEESFNKEIETNEDKYYISMDEKMTFDKLNIINEIIEESLILIPKDVNINHVFGLDTTNIKKQ